MSIRFSCGRLPYDLFYPDDAPVWDATTREMVPVPDGSVTRATPIGGCRAILFGLTGVSLHLVHDRMVLGEGCEHPVRHCYDGNSQGVLHHGLSRAGVLRGWRVLFMHDFLQLFLSRLVLGLTTTFSAFLRERLVAFALPASKRPRVLSLLKAVFREVCATDGDDCSDRCTGSLLRPFMGIPQHLP